MRSKRAVDLRTDAVRLRECKATRTGSRSFHADAKSLTAERRTVEILHQHPWLPPVISASTVDGVVAQARLAGRTTRTLYRQGDHR